MFSGSARWPRIGLIAAVATLAVTYVAMTLTASRSKSVAFDELPHLTAGYIYWQKGDFRMQPENGVFPQRWAALPFLFTHPALPPPQDPDWQEADVWRLGYRFFNQLGNDPDSLLLQGRAMIALLGALTGILVFVWARRLFGSGGGLVAMILAVFCPALLAHGSIATSDMAFTCILLAATLAVWELLHVVTALRLAAGLVTVALLFLTKMSAPLFIAMAAGMVVIRLFSRRELSWRLGRVRSLTTRREIAAAIAGLVAVHLLFAWGAVWAAYDFRYAASPQEAAGGAHFLTTFTPDWGTNAAIQLLHLLNQARLLPEAYLYGYEHVLQFARYRMTFFNGEYSFAGRMAFFPYAFLVKTPLSVFPLLLLAGWSVARGARADHAKVRAILYAIAPLLLLLAVFGAAALTARLNIGHRHILPLYPPLYILAGAAWPLATDAFVRWRKGAVLALVLLFVAESWAIRPDYLAYFNCLDGGPDQAWRHLVDSSLDWGMDLPALAQWVKHEQSRHGAEQLYFAYFGTGAPEHYGLTFANLPGEPDWRTEKGFFVLGPGLYAVSATQLQIYAENFGPWNRVYEDQYQQVSAEVSRLVNATPDEQQALLAEKSPEYWTGRCITLEHLRFSRLCVWLRRHEPLVRVAHSIFVWRLSDADLHAALHDAPAELAPAPLVVPPELLGKP